jgi:glucuronate isomerase
MPKLVLDEDRLFPAEAETRRVARALYESVRDLPIISPHGHADPAWFAQDEPFTNATELLVSPDHYLYRMLYSQGVSLETLGVASRDGVPKIDPREAWRTFARHFHLFRGTPSALWLNHVFAKLFGLDVVLDAETADVYFDTIAGHLKRPEFRPRKLYERFNIEVLATTEAADDPLLHHTVIRRSGWRGSIVPTYRPDTAIDPEHERFRESLEGLSRTSGLDVSTWKSYLDAHRARRRQFIAAGATATDHGHASARTADLDRSDAEKLFGKVMSGNFAPEEAELFRAQMLTEMARMSLDDGLVMQLHPGSFRNHNRKLFDSHGRDRGADIPVAMEYVRALKPLLDRFGNESKLTLIVFTLDESTYSRELAPLAGHYPALRLGPAWWFQDGPEGLRRYRELTTEVAGFYNTVGFNDDTRAFLSVPARHDVARRIDCGYLARLVCEHRLSLEEAGELAIDLSYRLPRAAYKFDGAKE